MSNVTKNFGYFNALKTHGEMNLICSKFSQYLAPNYPQWNYCQKFILVFKRSVCFASLEKKYDSIQLKNFRVGTYSRQHIELEKLLEKVEFEKVVAKSDFLEPNLPL